MHFFMITASLNMPPSLWPQQEAGLTLFEIASIMTRPFEGGGEELSDLEKFASYARSAIEVCGC